MIPTSSSSSAAHTRGRTTVPVRAGQIESAARRLAEGPPAGDIELDFAGVEFIGSEELGALIVLNRKVRATGGGLRLVNVGPPVAGVFSVTRLDTILEVRQTGAAAA